MGMFVHDDDESFGEEYQEILDELYKNSSMIGLKYRDFEKEALEILKERHE